MSIFYSNQNLANNYRRLFLKDYKVEMLIGFLAHEKLHKQNVIFNIEVFVPLNQSTSYSDNVDEVFNYDMIIQTIEKYTQNTAYNLQETLCDKILDELYNYECIHAVGVNIYKQQAYDKAMGAGVERFKHKLKLS